MNKTEETLSLQKLTATQEKIAMRLEALENIRNKDIEKSDAIDDEIRTRLKKIDQYIEKQTNFSEFKETYTKNIRQNIMIVGVLVTMIVGLTGWSLWEKGLYTPVPIKKILISGK